MHFQCHGFTMNADYNDFYFISLNYKMHAVQMMLYLGTTPAVIAV